MSEATQTQTLEQTLNRTDLGHVIYENRKIFFGILIAILVGATGFVLWKQGQKSAALETSVKVFEFQNNTWANVKTGKSGVPELVKSFENLDANVRSAPVMLPIVLEIGKFLYEKGQFQEAETILSQATSSAKHPVASFFLSMQRAAILEKLGKTDEAISVLEPVAQSKEVLMPARVSLELGRLYLAKGEKGKAQTQFDYILSTFPNEAEAKMAKLYLSQLSK
jgi:predicted negative regulator of RcsB-dependent stress response